MAAALAGAAMLASRPAILSRSLTQVSSLLEEPEEDWSLEESWARDKTSLRNWDPGCPEGRGDAARLE